ncbi:MAG: Holliday junction branch migration protein RuvA [Gemmataceae bacterium]|nr:helix-hairpin-helix domain-containing protein [Gemmata sp.]MDW8196238.1 Holliday junction branch migration protein RuvA [Gemmataceae bacterium]
MITKMTGLLTRVLDEEVRLQVGPFEYQVLVPEAVRRQIQLRVGQEITLHITEYIEGNSAGSKFVPRRIGFNNEWELEFFELFCTVEKIGVKKALKAMAHPVKSIADAISRQDTKWLSLLPGIGATTAEQIVTTLKRKVTKFVMLPAATDTSAPPASEPAGGKKGKPNSKKAAEEAPASVVNESHGQLIEDVYLALMGLGLNPMEARGQIDRLLTGGQPFANVAEALALIFAHRGSS